MRSHRAAIIILLLLVATAAIPSGPPQARAALEVRRVSQTLFVASFRAERFHEQPR